jgi:hypothetical protein
MWGNLLIFFGGLIVGVIVTFAFAALAVGKRYDELPGDKDSYLFGKEVIDVNIEKESK